MRPLSVPLLFAPVALGTVLLLGIARLPLPARRAHLEVGSSPIPAIAPAYHRPRWSHPESSCRDTRAVLLAQRCASVAWDPKGCHVTAATCRDVYTGLDVTTDSAPQALQVDHLLPAVEAWRRRLWAPGVYARFFNDPDNLSITRSRTNDQKGDLMPGQWCPALRGVRMLLSVRFQRVADRYQIPLSPQDAAGLAAWRRGECAPGAKVLGAPGEDHAQ